MSLILFAFEYFAGQTQCSILVHICVVKLFPFPCILNSVRLKITEASIYHREKMSYPNQGGQPPYGAPPPQGHYGQAPGYPPQGQYGQYPQQGPPGHGPPTGQPAYNPGYPAGPPQPGYPQNPQQYAQQPYQQPSYHGPPQGQAPPSGGGYGDASAPPGEYFACGNYPVGQPTAPTTWKRKPSPKLIISLTATNLSDRDITSKSDPMAVMFIHDVATQASFVLGPKISVRVTVKTI